MWYKISEFASCVLLYNWLVGYYQELSNSYNMGKRDLPDIYARPEGAGIYIRKILSAHVITNIFHFRHSKNLPKIDINISASLYSNGYSL